MGGFRDRFWGLGGRSVLPKWFRAADVWLFDVLIASLDRRRLQVTSRAPMTIPSAMRVQPQNHSSLVRPDREST
jgi:hypothetical protein